MWSVFVNVIHAPEKNTYVLGTLLDRVYKSVDSIVQIMFIFSQPVISLIRTKPRSIQL